MKRRTFLQKVAGGAVAPAAFVDVALPRPAFNRGKTEWQMITQFRVNSKHQDFARIIAEASDGQLQIRLSSRGSELPSKVIGDVSSGKVEVGWGNMLFSPSEKEGTSRVRKVPAADFLIIPFGLTAQESNGWIEYGGGRELVDRIYEQIGCKYFPAGNTGIQMGGWFAKEINSIDDLKGLKIRISGFGAAVLKAVGAEPYDVAPWSEDARRALMDGRLDAFELGNPASDLDAGLHERFKYYYYPAWHEPSVPFPLFINRTRWDALPSYIKTIVSTAARWLNDQWLNERMVSGAAALETLVKEHGVQLRQFPEAVLTELAQVSDQILREQASQDKLSQEVFDSIVQFRRKVSRRAMVSLHPFFAARATL